MKHRYRDVVRDALPGTWRDIHQRTGLGRTTIWRWLTHLHAAGDIHIAGWLPGGTPGTWLARYAVGAGRDVPKPTPLTEAQKSRAYRARARRDGDWQERLARQRARYWTRRARADPLLVALARPTGVTHETT